MAKHGIAAAETKSPTLAPAPRQSGRPSSLLDTRVVYCGDNLEQLAKLPDACADLIYIDPAPVSAVEPPFNSSRNYEVFWVETKEKRAFEDRHASTQAYIDYMRPRCVQLARVLKNTGSVSDYCLGKLRAIFGDQANNETLDFGFFTSRKETHVRLCTNAVTSL